VTRGLRNSSWSLADALSEEVEVTALDSAKAMVLTTDGTPVQKTVMAASTSRLIAFVGMIAILFLYIGFGIFVLWGFAETGEVPASTDAMSKYFVAGLTLFAPYIVNKFSSVFAK
jgi:hypothetical protein